MTAIRLPGSRLGLVLLLVLVTVMASTTAKAAVVSPPSFEALVATAGDIFLGQVTGRASRVEMRGAKRLIVTDVTFRVDKVVKGEPRRLATLTFLGGSIGEVRMDVPGMPTFMVGDRDVVFVNRGRPTLMPIVGLFHGRFHVVTGPGGSGEYVANAARQPLSTTADYAHPARLAANARPLALADFLRAIRDMTGRR
jgi:hypothetical protein